MKVIAIIPTLNEADNIEFITKIIDNGLSKLPGGIEALIVNADSHSTDKTPDIFLNTETHFAKETILCKEKIGKGANIHEVLRKYRNSSDYFIMIDADVTSAEEDWVSSLLMPVLEGKAELTVPIYKRNRYEGNTTNHFSSPLISACFGIHIAQPIAGDFAFSKRMAKEIFDSFTCDSDYSYGIDTLITWTAVLHKFKVKQVRLGRKKHKPSFSKIVPMFGQVSCTTFNLINKNRVVLEKGVTFKKSGLDQGETIDDINIHPPSEEQMKDVLKTAHELIKKSQFSAINISKTFDNILSTKDWVDILAEFVRVTVRKDLNIDELESLSSLATGYYLLRVLGYFDEIKYMGPNDIEELLRKQRDMLSKRIAEMDWKCNV